MPGASHYACVHPPEQDPVCRFMDLCKFRDTMANDELYFRRVDLFKEVDPREGLPSDDYVRQVFRLRRHVLEDELELNDQQAFIRQHSEGQYISCWQVFTGETMEMWESYGRGVCIFSRFGLLKAELDRLLDTIYVGIVRYGEKNMGQFNLIDFLFRKQFQFAHEKELRLLLQSYDPMSGANRHFDENSIPHREPLDDKYPLHNWVHECKRRRVDLRSIVTQIRVSPWATKKGVEEVWWWRKNKGFTCPLSSSDLAIPPTPIPEHL